MGADLQLALVVFAAIALLAAFNLAAVIGGEWLKQKRTRRQQ